MSAGGCNQASGHEQVPTVEGLCVRVINNVRKKTEVKPKFAEAFQHESYPSEFPYRQKVLAALRIRNRELSRHRSVMCPLCKAGRC